MMSFKLTADDIGLPEFLKADLDSRKYPRREGKFAAERYGELAIARIKDALRTEWITPRGIQLAEEDAVMFAKLAFHGWRAYRVMFGE
jgi:hypothetical protein